MQPLQHDKAGSPEASEGQRTARRTPPGTPRRRFVQNVRVASAAGASSKSELDALCTRRWKELYVRETHTTAVYGPRRGYILSAGAFKQGLCEYLFKLPFSAARARQSPRRARQTLRPASRYTDGRYRRPPPVCNCVSGSREPNRALREQQAPTARHTTQRKLKRRSHGLGRALAHGGLRAHRLGPRPFSDGPRRRN